MEGELEIVLKLLSFFFAHKKQFVNLFSMGRISLSLLWIPCTSVQTCSRFPLLCTCNNRLTIFMCLNAKCKWCLFYWSEVDIRAVVFLKTTTPVNVVKVMLKYVVPWLQNGNAIRKQWQFGVPQMTFKCVRLLCPPQFSTYPILLDVGIYLEIAIAFFTFFHSSKAFIFERKSIFCE